MILRSVWIELRKSFGANDAIRVFLLGLNCCMVVCLVPFGICNEVALISVAFEP